MTKKELMFNLQAARLRIRTLECLICPAGQHDWFPDYSERVEICKKCQKVVAMLDFE